MAAPHVAVVVFPFFSHAAKLFRLARALAAASPATTITLLSTASSIAKLREAGAPQRNLRFVEVPDASPPKCPTGGGGETAVSPFADVELFLAAAEAGGVREALEAARVSAGGARVSCVLGDSFMWMAADAAAAVEAPWVPVWTGGPSALLSYLRADVLRHDVGDEAMNRADELLTSHPGLGTYLVRDLPGGILSGDPDLPFHALFRRIAQHLPRAATAVALNFFPGLIPQDITDALASELPNCLPIGPFHLLPDADADGAPADPYGCLSWLDQHSTRCTVAYASFGTIAEAWARPEELRELAAGMEATGAPILWSLTEKSWPQLPPGFLELARVKVVPWAPQVEVLRHASVGAFVSHAGWASVLEAASSGVPMACRPFFGDQMMNARSVQAWGMGTTLHEPITRDGVATSLTLLGLGLGGGDQLQGQGIVSRMQELKAMAAAAFAPDGANSNNFGKLVNIVCAPAKFN